MPIFRPSPQRGSSKPPKSGLAPAVGTVAPSRVQIGLELFPLPRPVAIWDSREHLFTAILLFYSHTRRAKEDSRIDQALGIDRRCFSNLFVDTEPLRVAVGPEERLLFRHEFLGEVAGCCSESFLQAARCQEEADARFIVAHLNELQAAKYGQGRLTLNEAQVQALVELGVDGEAGFERFMEGWRRVLPVRSDWDEVKADVVVHVLRHKFTPPPPGGAAKPLTTAQATALSLVTSRRKWFLVNHIKNDRQWGDAADGSGCNILGKCLAQVLLELIGATPRAPRLSTLPPGSGALDHVSAPSAQVLLYRRGGMRAVERGQDV